MNKLTMRRTELPAGVVQLELSGEIDFAVSNDLTAAQMREIDAPGVTRLIVDLREVTFLDSTGLRTITSADARARKDGHELRIVRGSDQVQKLLHVTGMDKILPLVDDPSEPLSQP